MIKNVTLYSKPNCQYCEKAKFLLESNSIQHSVIHLDVGQSKVDGVSYISRDDLLQLIPNAKTMPQIIVDGQVIGGYTELAKLLA